MSSAGIILNISGECSLLEFFSGEMADLALVRTIGASVFYFLSAQISVGTWALTIF